MRRLVVPLIVLALAVAGPHRPAHAGPPTDQVKGATDQVLKILQDPALKPPDKSAEAPGLGISNARSLP